MNYIKYYIKLIRKSKNRKKPNGYTERHHVFPVSIYGKNENTVYLTAKEHYIAHVLLYKACQKRYGEFHHKTIKMARAWWNMTMRHTESRYTSKTFSIARERMAVSFAGENNPAKKPGVGQKISHAKKGKTRNDMKGKRYFGADKETIKNGIEKMRKKKIGQKIDYPKNRKSSPCSEEKAEKIKEVRLKTKQKFVDMTDKEFENWIEKQNLFCKDGKRKNSNVTRALMWRNIPIDKYYD